MQKKPGDPFRASLQPLIWSIGALSGVLAEAEERRLLVAAIMDLLRLVATKPAKDDKAVVAGCLMYVIQQFPRFLKAHFKFLRTVIAKNFEFMHETHPGVQDMACDTFLKLAKFCGGSLVVAQHVDGVENRPYIEEVLGKSEVLMERLSQQQKEVVFEAIATIIRFERNAEKRAVWVDALLYGVNNAMISVIKQGCQNQEVFHQSTSIAIIRDVFHFHRVVCSVLPNDYHRQVSTFPPFFCIVFDLLP